MRIKWMRFESGLSQSISRGGFDPVSSESCFICVGDASGQMIRHVSWAHVARRNAANALKDALMNYSLAVAGWSSEGTLASTGKTCGSLDKAGLQI